MMKQSEHWFPAGFLSLHDRTAIICRDRKHTFGELIDKIREFGNTIIPGITPGEAVLLLSDYSFDSIALFFALLSNKNIIVPAISPNDQEINTRITISRAGTTIRFTDAGPAVSGTGLKSDHPLYETLRKKGAAGLVLFSSGITGEPKAMLHDLDLLLESYKKNTLKDVNTLVFLTFDHIGGIDTLLSLLSIGGTVTIPEKRDPESICELIEKQKVNVLSCSPTFLNLLILSETYKTRDLSSLKIIGFGAEQMPDFLYRKVKETFPWVALQQKFGTSETNAIRVKNSLEDPLYMTITDPNIEYRIVDNELWLKSRTQILGYLNVDHPDFEEGWFRTGDIVDIRDDGYFRIMGRKKEVINVGGEKVFPGEVENVILNVDKVTGCSVYGVKNLITGEMVVAEVTLTQETNPAEMKQAVREACLARLDPYKRPSRILIVEKLSVNERFKKLRKPGN